MDNTQLENQEPWKRYAEPSKIPEDDLFYGTRGDAETAKIMIVGECWGQEEKRMKMPFMGKSGQILEILLREAGIPLSDCFFTNIISFQPPGNNMSSQFYPTKQARTVGSVNIRGLYPNRLVDDGLTILYRQIHRIRPKLIIGLGNYTLWALTENDFIVNNKAGKLIPAGIGDYRGSQLRCTIKNIPFLPTYHPTATFKTYPWRAMILHDLKMRATKVYQGFFDNHWDGRKNKYLIGNQINLTLYTLERLLRQPRQTLGVDIETRSGFIACLGIAWTDIDAICIPILSTQKGKKRGYWSAEGETLITQVLQAIFDKHNIVGQNFAFDAQYIFNQMFYKFDSFDDTMIMHHCLYPGGGDPTKSTGPQGLVQKSLNHISSLYNHDHKYWKSEGKLWETSMPEEQLWTYNCRDCCATLEAYGHLKRELKQANLWEQYEFQKLQSKLLAMPMMLKGIKIDEKARSDMQLELLKAISEFENKIVDLIPPELLPKVAKNAAPWYKSPKQLAHIFYNELGIKPVRSPTTGNPSTGKQALPILKKREPLVGPIVDAIGVLRSLGVFYGNFLQAEVDPDMRMRCSFNVAGTETFRWSSSKNPWDRGTNFQNIPAGDDEDDYEKLQQTRGVVFPNVKKLFIPDRDYIIVDADLSGADAQVVAWESGDEEMKEALKKGIKIHSVTAIEREGNDDYPHYDAYKRRIHATNYGGGPNTLHKTLLGLYGPQHTSVANETEFQQWWFERHPGIKDWHDRVQHSINTTHGVKNKFGNRVVYVDRLDTVFNQALAWIPQSTVALVCFKGGILLAQEFPMVQLLSQVHDSLVFQIHKAYRKKLPEINEALNSVAVPYDDPLTIPWGLKISDKSWGDCK